MIEISEKLGRREEEAEQSFKGTRSKEPWIARRRLEGRKKRKENYAK